MRISAELFERALGVDVRDDDTLIEAEYIVDWLYQAALDGSVEVLDVLRITWWRPDWCAALSKYIGDEDIDRALAIADRLGTSKTACSDEMLHMTHREILRAAVARRKLMELVKRKGHDGTN